MHVIMIDDHRDKLIIEFFLKKKKLGTRTHKRRGVAANSLSNLHLPTYAFYNWKIGEVKNGSGRRLMLKKKDVREIRFYCDNDLKQ